MYLWTSPLRGTFTSLFIQNSLPEALRSFAAKAREQAISVSTRPPSLNATPRGKMMVSRTSLSLGARGWPASSQPRTPLVAPSDLAPNSHAVNSEELPWFAVLPPSSGDIASNDTQPAVRDMSVPLPPAPKSRAPKSRTLREADWAQVKPYIIQYLATKPLREIVGEIQAQFGFKATCVWADFLLPTHTQVWLTRKRRERQYKSALKRWKVGKNITRSEMKAIVRKQQRRKLAEPEKGELQFKVRGEPVSKGKIHRFMRRDCIPHDATYSPASGASTPDADIFFCQTPPESSSTTSSAPSSDVAVSQQSGPSSPSSTAGEPSSSPRFLGVSLRTLEAPTSSSSSDEWNSTYILPLHENHSSLLVWDMFRNSRDQEDAGLMGLADAAEHMEIGGFATVQEAAENARVAPYLRLLKSFVAGELGQERSRSVQEVLDVVGPVVVLAEPLTISSVAELLDTTPSAISSKLNPLHSAMSIPSVGCPSTFDPSFRDFLVDPGRCMTNEFWVDEAKYHKRIANRCLRLLSCLRRDICDLKKHESRRRDVNKQTIDIRLPPCVRYACLYWVYHLVRGNDQVTDGDQTHLFLKRHFLHWLEALCLLGEVLKSVEMVKCLGTHIKPHCSVEVKDFVSDAERFISNCIEIIDIWPLQVYYSAIVFCPEHERSIIRRTFAHETLSLLSKFPRVDKESSVFLQTLKAHYSLRMTHGFMRHAPAATP
ncbi:Vegetative incompatibility protein HET-E-1 [Tolypocladium ophioglossoides CBS 100239]|uniref:Vegetative incompatibility protein HET-E-1 n=1 Tax=Tolypocladium ophioglossoides (strain CBS 100239) TaxID=1163406 RepID=A0A0L0N356_TOLOC|nr:Vegetative incompatibility protein HET-E-1 [Tolypocladium ophioglossoides CBS 100239]